MDRRIIASIVIALIIIVVGGYLTLNKKPTEPAVTSVVTSSNSPQPEANSNQEMSLKALFAAGGSKKCTFSDSTDNYSSTGTIYMGNSKMRGDFSSTVSSKNYGSHMIVDNQVSYLWTDGQPQGFKMSLSALPSPNASAKTQSNVDINKNLNFKCDSWTVDSSLFVLPSGMTFSDMSQMMAPTGSNSAGTGNNAQCATCNSLSGDAKTQCLKALSCN